MVQIGFHAPHEKVDPGPLLEAVRLAGAAGFDAAMSLGHFSHWSARQETASSATRRSGSIATARAIYTLALPAGELVRITLERIARQVHQLH